jgi:hypothetical protein
MGTKTERGPSPKAVARAIGALYLLTVALGAFAQGFIADRMIVPSDAAATVVNILANEPLYRLVFALYLVEMGCQVGMTVLFYDLLRPVGWRLAMVTMVFGLVGCSVKIVSRLFYFAPLIVLGGAQSIPAFGPGQTQGLVALLLRLDHQCEAMAMVFFGAHAVLAGYLIARSGYLPRLLGALSVLGGLGWLTYLSPPLGDRLVPFILPIAGIGAAAMIGWLLVVGVDEARWFARAMPSGGI